MRQKHIRLGGFILALPWAGLGIIAKVHSVELPAILAWQPMKRLNAGVGVQNLLDNHHPEVLQSVNCTAATKIPQTYFMQLTWRY